MVDRIALDCRDISLSENARLGAGANAVGIKEHEFETLLSSDKELALVLKYAVAYNAIKIQRNYRQGGKFWCLVELSGIVCLAHGLTLKHGGFLERDLSYLQKQSA